MSRWPIWNFALIIVTSLVFLYAAAVGSEPNEFYRFVLDGWNLSGMLGHLFLHADFTHLLGNMIFLWVFGNAICAKVGNFAYARLRWNPPKDHCST